MSSANHNRDLTLAYVTFRPNPKLEWWLDSLNKQADELHAWPLIKRIVIVSPHKITAAPVCSYVITRPCPGVWQGPHRLTKADYFDVANARNTAIALAPTSHIVFSDDLSVLMPGWLQQVVDALNSEELSRKIVCGAYRKVNKLNVVDGKVASFEDHPPGVDHRTLLVRGSEPQPCRGQWAFGCSLMAPIEALLSVNGYDQDTASLSYEDVVLGQMLENRGHEFVFAPRMMTYESEELHHDPSNPRYLRWDPGVSPNDMSHRMLQMLKDGRNWAPNYYPWPLREMRQRILAGEPFPIVQNPQHHWFTGHRLQELPLE